MKTRLLPAIALTGLLAGCQTTDDSEWIGGGATPFNQAERSCMELTEAGIDDDSEREEFFIGCMEALGWTPKRGTRVSL